VIHICVCVCVLGVTWLRDIGRLLVLEGGGGPRDQFLVPSDSTANACLCKYGFMNEHVAGTIRSHTAVKVGSVFFHVCR